MIAEALAAACADASVLARLAGPLGVATRARVSELARLTGSAQRATRAAWAAAARAPVPPGIRGVHPTWIEAALADLPARARADLAAGGGDRVAVWLVRRACAELPPLPAADATGVPRSIDDAVRLDGDALAAWLTSIGADQLAFALGAAGGDAVRGAARVVGNVLLEAAARITRPPRTGALGPHRAAIARCRVASLDDEHVLARIGARAFAPHVDTLARRQLAVRLPRPLGVMVGEELATRTALELAPSWSALGADIRGPA